MHLLESYALTCGCFIDKCFIEEEEIDLPKSKYITLHSFNNKGTSRQYSHWHSVISYLKKDPRFNHEIVQIGGSEDFKYDINTSYLGQTSCNSLAYLIKYSDLHLGFDSFPVHLASHYNKKIVALYPQYAKNTGPYFSKKEDVYLFETYRYTNQKPIFEKNDPNGTINKIPPERIAEAVLDLLYGQNV
jgi:ADP-heptose:LPS heptosyltransferase